MELRRSLQACMYTIYNVNAKISRLRVKTHDKICSSKSHMNMMVDVLNITGVGLGRGGD